MGQLRRDVPATSRDDEQVKERRHHIGEIPPESALLFLRGSVRRKGGGLGECTRPRDLYDVVNLYHNGEFAAVAVTIRQIVQAKCNFKKIPS